MSYPLVVNGSGLAVLLVFIMARLSSSKSYRHNGLSTKGPDQVIGLLQIMTEPTRILGRSAINSPSSRRLCELGADLLLKIYLVVDKSDLTGVHHASSRDTLWTPLAVYHQVCDVTRHLPRASTVKGNWSH